MSCGLHLFPSTCVQFDIKEISVLCKPSSSRRLNPSAISLVDPGSAADLLQLPAFRQMNISFDRLSSAGRIMSGFNGATTITMGDIDLPVKAGPVVQ